MLLELYYFAKIWIIIHHLAWFYLSLWHESLVCQLLAFKHLQVESDLLPPIWKFKAVRQEIYNHLDKPAFVPINLSVCLVVFFVVNRHNDQLNVLLDRDMPDYIESLINHLKNVEELFIQLEGTLLYLTQVQQIHHKISHHLTCVRQYLHCFVYFIKILRVLLNFL